MVDLCWGIRNDSSGDHKACEIFLHEIKRCQRISAGPAFIVSLLSFLNSEFLVQIVLIFIVVVDKGAGMDLFVLI